MSAAGINVVGVKKVVEALQRLAEVTETPAAKAVLGESASELKTRLVDKAPRATGRMAGAIGTGFFDPRKDLSAAAVVGVGPKGFYWRFTNSRGRTAGWVEDALKAGGPKAEAKLTRGLGKLIDRAAKG